MIWSSGIFLHSAFDVQIRCSVFRPCVLFNAFSHLMFSHSLLGPYSTLCPIRHLVIRCSVIRCWVFRRSVIRCSVIRCSVFRRSVGESGTDMDTDTGHRVLNTSRPRQFSKDSDIGNNFNPITDIMWDSTLFSPNRIFWYQAQSDIVLHGILDWVPTYAEGVALLETCEKYVLYIYSTYTSF